MTYQHGPLEGEVVQDDAVDRLWDRIVGGGLVGPREVKDQVRRQLSEVPDLNFGRALCAALGAAVGSLYRGVGSAAGGAAGSVLYDTLVENRKKRRVRKKKPPLLEQGDDDVPYPYHE